jgi:Signal peptidase subunit
VHTAAYRANALLTYSGSALAILAVLASLTGALRQCRDEACSLTRTRPLAPLEPCSGRPARKGGAPVLAREHERGARRRGTTFWAVGAGSVSSLSAQAYLAFSLHADLSSSFSWNTKLLFVYLVAEYATPLNELNQVRSAVPFASLFG